MGTSCHFCFHYLGISLVCYNVFRMKRTLLHPVFLVCLGLAILNQTLEKGFGIYFPVVHSYLDDLLCFPIVFTLGLAVYRLVDPEYKLRFLHMAPVLVLYSAYFEGYLPTVSTAVADGVDLVMYLLGTVVFSYFINTPNTLSLRKNKQETT